MSQHQEDWRWNPSNPSAIERYSPQAKRYIVAGSFNDTRHAQAAATVHEVYLACEPLIVLAKHLPRDTPNDTVLIKTSKLNITVKTLRDILACVEKAGILTNI